MTPEQRKESAQAANETIRNMPKEFHEESSKKQAIKKQQTQSKVGLGEIEVYNACEKIGYKPILQKAIGVYNIDLAVGNIAIEVYNTTRSPHKEPKLIKRTVQLLKSGYHVVYFKNAGRVVYNEIGSNKIVK